MFATYKRCSKSIWDDLEIYGFIQTVSIKQNMRFLRHLLDIYNVQNMFERFKDILIDNHNL